MELLEDNHRVELRVYQQKVKHLEYEHRNNIKSIIQDGTGLLENEQKTHEDRERELLRVKEQLKFEQMELELVNANKVAEVRSQHDKQLIKLRQQFEDSMTELKNRCEQRLQQLEYDLELRRKVEIHEVEERKNQHINDLIKNHKKAFAQMKAYYNDITSGNLKLIKNLQKKVEELKERANNNKKLLFEYVLENQKLSKPLSEVSNEINDLQTLLKERTKDQFALRNAISRLQSITRNSTSIRQKLKSLEEEYIVVERERDALYTGFEETIERVKAQTEFQNQALEQRLISAEQNVEKAGLQVEEIIQAANLDANEVSRMISSINQMMAAKEEVLRDLKFQVVKLQKGYNDSLAAFIAKLKELGIPSDDILEREFKLEPLPVGCTSAPVSSLVAKV